jgi:uncharacterized protein (TIGR00255 family)
VKSVNGRGLEIRCRLPQGLEGLEPAVRQNVTTAIKRGNVNVGLQLTWTAGTQAVRINSEVLDQVLALVPQVAQRLGTCGPPSVEGLLALRGVIESVDPAPTGEARAALEAVLLAGLNRVLADLSAVRRREGERLVAVLREHLRKLAGLCERAAVLASAQPPAILARLQQTIAALLADTPALSPERMAQEAALLAAKADPCEELDRIRAHREAADALLQGSGPVGRQLDFLCQEFNREANTLCAKSADIELTRLGLELKVTIEQMREQVQNIE